jgi:hypothetical protein
VPRAHGGEEAVGLGRAQEEDEPAAGRQVDGVVRVGERHQCLLAVIELEPPRLVSRKPGAQRAPARREFRLAIEIHDAGGAAKKVGRGDQPPAVEVAPE